jgi:hypothetical protein
MEEEKKEKKMSVEWKRKENVYRMEKKSKWSCLYDEKGIFFLKLSNGWKRKKMELCKR